MELNEITKEKIAELEDEIEEIVDEAKELVKGYEVENSKWSFGEDVAFEEPFELLKRYERWYNSAHPLINEYLKEREPEFAEEYEKVRECMEIDIQYLNNNEIKSAGQLRGIVMTALYFQRDLVHSIQNRVEAEKIKVKKKVSSDIVKEEILQARELLNDGNIRAAGVIVGVGLERHLFEMCESSSNELDYRYMEGITSLSQTLNDAKEITDDEHRLLEYLAGIRNKCSHASEENPSEAEVERMLNETSEFIQRM
jgi:hypothetical protein